MFVIIGYQFGMMTAPTTFLFKKKNIVFLPLVMLIQTYIKESQIICSIHKKKKFSFIYEKLTPCQFYLFWNNYIQELFRILLHFKASII